MSNLRKFQDSEIEVSFDRCSLSKADIVKAIQIGVKQAESVACFNEEAIIDRSLTRLYGNDNG